MQQAKWESKWYNAFCIMNCIHRSKRNTCGTVWYCSWMPHPECDWATLVMPYFQGCKWWTERGRVRLFWCWIMLKPVWLLNCGRYGKVLLCKNAELPGDIWLSAKHFIYKSPVPLSNGQILLIYPFLECRGILPWGGMPQSYTSSLVKEILSIVIGIGDLYQSLL